jgi:hypothetical protein
MAEMTKRIVLLVAVATALAVTASADAGGRYTGWAANAGAPDGTLRSPSHYLSMCAGVSLNFSDAGQEHTTYRVSVTKPRGKTVSWTRTTRNSFTPSAVLPRTDYWPLGRYVARWYVAGHLVASWRFQMRSCE